MSGHYANTPVVWPMLITASALLGMAVYAWRHRAVPGARPLAATLGLAVPWAVSAALEAAAVDFPTRVFWFKFQSLWPMAAATTGFWFSLEYASLDRYLTSRTLRLLALPAVVTALLVLTDSAHHLAWRAFSFDGYVRAVPGPAVSVLLPVGFAFAMATSLVFLWLFVQSPLHRWPAALCLCGQVVVRAGFALDAAEANPLAPIDVAVLGSSFLAVMYAIAAFRFGMFTVVPIGRGTVVEQMGEGMLILDIREAVMDLNPAAEKVLGLPAKRVRGRRLRELLPTSGGAWQPPPWEVPAGGVPTGTPGEKPDAVAKVLPRITTGSGQAARTHAVRVSTLSNRRGFRLGYLVLLQEVTEQERAQALVVDQQRALATLRERDRVARELHDGIGQVLGYLKMQAHTARFLLARGQTGEVDAYLAQMLAATQDTHADVREYILGSGIGPSDDSAFLPALERYVRRFGETCGISPSLEVQAGLNDEALDPMVAAQLLRIIQEALTNVRKHASASQVRVKLGTSAGRAEAVVEDDGKGFRASSGDEGEATTFGLRFMRERAEEVGGSVHVQSAPGGGTKILVSVPLRKGPS